MVVPLIWDASLRAMRPINGAGASGETIDPGVLPPGGAPSGWVLLQSLSPAGAATVDITGLDGTYDHYVVVVDKLVASTDNVYLYARVGTGSTPTWVTTGYLWTVGLFGYSASTFVNYSSTTEAITDRVVLAAPATGNRLGNGAGKSLSGVLHISAPAAALFPNLCGDLVYNRQTDNASYRVVAGGNLAVAGAITALRLALSAGTIASGAIRLYGVRAT